MNILQLAQMLRSGQNPQQIAMNMMMPNSPLGQNIMNLAQNGDASQLEQIARNLCASRGMDYDKEFSAFKHQLGLE